MAFFAQDALHGCHEAIDGAITLEDRCFDGLEIEDVGALPLLSRPIQTIEGSGEPWIRCPVIVCRLAGHCGVS
ncbi:hypothetical protein C0V97_00325 [Asaia sp. W19]|uniref:hypothetical protein n=1 Tax=unclassified Asaia TaxID=2685023 RepID=UPI000F8E0AAA|nr:hypothetical protein [Asaia sp. W19]RUT27561.1 hypothetical protein C0V97_00325 [Asaia sp. W19]